MCGHRMGFGQPEASPVRRVSPAGVGWGVCGGQVRNRDREDVVKPRAAVTQPRPSAPSTRAGARLLWQVSQGQARPAWFHESPCWPVLARADRAGPAPDPGEPPRASHDPHLEGEKAEDSCLLQGPPSGGRGQAPHRPLARDAATSHVWLLQLFLFTGAPPLRSWVFACASLQSTYNLILNFVFGRLLSIFETAG